MIGGGAIAIPALNSIIVVHLLGYLTDTTIPNIIPDKWSYGAGVLILTIAAIHNILIQRIEADRILAIEKKEMETPLNERIYGLFRDIYPRIKNYRDRYREDKFDPIFHAEHKETLEIYLKADDLFTKKAPFLDPALSEIIAEILELMKHELGSMNGLIDRQYNNRFPEDYDRKRAFVESRETVCAINAAMNELKERLSQLNE